MLLLGDRLTVGINTDASAVGGVGQVLAQRLNARLVNLEHQRRLACSDNAPGHWRREGLQPGNRYVAFIRVLDS